MFECIGKGINYSNKIINDLRYNSGEIALELSPVTPKTLIKDSLCYSRPARKRFHNK